MKPRFILFAIIMIIIAVMFSFRLPNQTEVAQFRLESYSYYIDNFPTNLVYGEAYTAEEALEIAQNVWMDEYDYDLSNHKYTISYDEEGRAWLICGNIDLLQRNDEMQLWFGGNPYIIITQNEGRVLALWHDK